VLGPAAGEKCGQSPTRSRTAFIVDLAMRATRPAPFRGSSRITIPAVLEEGSMLQDAAAASDIIVI